MEIAIFILYNIIYRSAQRNLNCSSFRIVITCKEQKIINYKQFILKINSKKSVTLYAIIS